jgi:hypothetical protein
MTAKLPISLQEFPLGSCGDASLLLARFLPTVASAGSSWFGILATTQTLSCNIASKFEVPQVTYKAHRIHASSGENATEQVLCCVSPPDRASPTRITVSTD